MKFHAGPQYLGRGNHSPGVIAVRYTVQKTHPVGEGGAHERPIAHRLGTRHVNRAAQSSVPRRKAFSGHRSDNPCNGRLESASHESAAEQFDARRIHDHDKNAAVTLN